MDCDFAGLDATQHRLEPVDVHDVVKAIVDRLRHERVVRDLALSGEILRARKLIGKDRCHEVLGIVALKRGR